MSSIPFDPLAQVTDLRTAPLLFTGVVAVVAAVVIVLISRQAAGDPKQATQPGRSIHAAHARTEWSAPRARQVS